jgi:flagellar hook-basal body complex protein FliE
MAGIEGLGAISPLMRAGATAAAAAPTGVDGAGALDATGSVGSIGATGTDASESGGSFLDALGDAFGQLNTQLTGADAQMASFASGGSADLHTVMLELQQASIGLKTGIAVRDKLLEAYQELMRLQI